MALGRNRRSLVAPAHLAPWRPGVWVGLALGGLVAGPACSGGGVGPRPSVADSGDPSGDTSRGDTAPGEDDTSEHIDAPDTGPGYLEGDPPALCQVRLRCPTTIPDEPKLGCRITVEDGDGRVHYDGPAGLESRGRSSASAPKPQYGVELWDEDGNEVDRALLGLSSDSDWVLNGNYYDRSLFRSKLGFDLFRNMGETATSPRYGPRGSFCELTLDGASRGIYTLVERIKQGEERVDLSADDGQGQSWIVELKESETIAANSGGYGGWAPVYPKAGELTDAQAAGIAETIDRAYAAMASDQPADAFELIDRDALIDIVLIEEFMKNNDGWYLSLHMYKDAGGRIAFVPWDLDLTLGQPSYNDNENTESWIAYRPNVPATLAATEGFDAAMATRWAQLREGPLSEEAVLALMDRYVETMGPGLDRNWELWPIEEVDFGGYLYPVGSYEEELARVRAWALARLTWMDAAVVDY